MAEQSKIEWTDATFNPWIGCTKVSPGCDNCYAARQDAHRKWTPDGWGGPRKRTKTWGDPVKWNAAHEAFFAEHGRRQRVFCASLADWLDNQVPIKWLVDLLELVRTTPNLDWLLLTKRIGNWRHRVLEAISFKDGISQELAAWLGGWLDDEPPANVWLGATVVNQQEAERDVPQLQDTPAAVRFLSIEPMLGPITLGRGGTEKHGYLARTERGDWVERGDGEPFRDTWTYADHPLEGKRSTKQGQYSVPRIDWVICGGESGPGARPMHPDWARSLRDQCAAAGVPFMFKQHGEWAPGSGDFGAGRFKTAAVASDGTTVTGGYDASAYPRGAESRDGWAMVHWAGKKAAGRLLDGVEHNGFPEAACAT